MGKTEEQVSFVSATIHELKTSLTAIIVSAELLGEELQTEKDVPARLIRSIIQNAHSINERLSRFSEIGGILLKNPRLHLEPVQVGRVIQDVTTKLYPLAQSKRQSLVVDELDSLPLVKADRKYVEEILATLVANAIKFTPEGGKIKVRAWAEGTNLVVRVSDSGIGIPEREREHLFQPYYQVNRGDGQKYPGSGLGLAISKLLVEAHHGKMWLESAAGQGSSFYFSLPAMESR